MNTKTKEEILARIFKPKDKEALDLSALIYANSGSMICFTKTESGCLESYTHITRVGGYTQIRCGNIMEYLHRYVYFLLHPNTDTGLDIMHNCDNKACCNPRHLIAGTHKENMNDRDLKGRNVAISGLKHYESRFTRNEIIAIRKACETSCDSTVAERYNVSRSTISSIRNGHRYSDIV
jgi:hypothetical protein